MKKSAVMSDMKDNSLFLSILKGSLVALTVSLVGVLIFAFIMRFVPISDSLISPINQVIKGVSILIGCFVGLKKAKEMGLISGLLIGFVYTALAFLTFSILNGEFVFSRTILNDLLFGAIIGAICGIVAVNLKRKSV